MISIRMPILSYTIQVVVPNFKILGAVVPEKPLTQISLMHYIGVKDGNKRTMMVLYRSSEQTDLHTYC